MSRKKSIEPETISPSPTAYSFSAPNALEREVSTIGQLRWDEGTLKYGEDDAFPLRIIDAVNQSPTTSSCIGTIETFIRGNGFSEESLMLLPIDKDGTTLYELHCKLAQYLALLDGFCVNFKFDSQGKITNAYLVGLETVRFKRPPDGENNKVIDCVKVNPYFGTSEYKRTFSTEYPLWNLAAVKDQINLEGTQFKGQIYYHGGIRPPYKFYPVPKYWSGQQWIYVDGQIQQFHKENLDNGFFQSVLMTQIGDPNQMTKNPKYQTTDLAADGVTKIQRSTKTVGEEFNDQMGSMFSGVKKAGTVMNIWAKTLDQAPKLQSFPVNSQFDVLAGTFTDAIRGITIATEVPAILANLPQQNSSLGSDGNAMNMAVQLMQSRVSGKKKILENFYNNVLLPNLQKSVTEKVKILDYSPIASTIDYYNFHAFELYWNFMNDQEKADFLNANVDEIKVAPRPATQSVQLPTTVPGKEPPAPTQINDNLKNLTGRQQQNLSRIIRNFIRGNSSQIEATMLLKNGFGVSDIEVLDLLGINDTPQNETVNPLSVSK